jgi:hypothetical protein
MTLSMRVVGLAGGCQATIGGLKFTAKLSETELKADSEPSQAVEEEEKVEANGRRSERSWLRSLTQRIMDTYPVTDFEHYRTSLQRPMSCCRWNGISGCLSRMAVSNKTTSKQQLVVGKIFQRTHRRRLCMSVANQLGYKVVPEPWQAIGGIGQGFASSRGI